MSAEELLDMRADVAAGRGDSVRISEGTFSLAEHERFLAENARDIASSREEMERARAEERERWSLAGEFTTGAAGGDVDKSSSDTGDEPKGKVA